MAGQNSDIANIVSKISSSGGVYGDYQELITDLAAINMPYANPQANILHNPIDTSYIAAARSDRLMANTPKTYSKKSIYGVVVGVVGGGPLVPFTGKTYYVDVPPFNKKFISHPDNFPYNDSEKLKDYEDLIFEYQGWDLLSGIGHKDIVEVQIPDNYPNHILTNKSDALILKRVCAAAVNPNTDTSKASESAPSGLKAANEKPGLQYGAADIPYSWALTKIGKAPSNLAATELKSINKAINSLAACKDKLNEYDKIISKICRDIGEVSPIFIKAIMIIESNIKLYAVSPTGAGGLMQLTSATWNEQIKKETLSYTKEKNFNPRPKTIVKNKTHVLDEKNKEYSIDQHMYIAIYSFRNWLKQTATIVGAAGAYNNGYKAHGESNRGVFKNPIDFNETTVEATNYIFMFNALVNLISKETNVSTTSVSGKGLA